MSSKNILILLLLISSSTFGQIYKPTYQNNNSLDFTRFLSGVKYAYVSMDDKDVEYITKNPSSVNANAIIGLLSYLKAIGFEDVRWGSGANPPQNFPSICELVIVGASWSYDQNSVKDIKLGFSSCKGDIFRFDSSKNIYITGYTNVASSFHNTFMKMYGYNKGSYSPFATESLQSNTTDWTEQKLKSYFKEKGADEMEGIYESAQESPLMPKYKLGLIKNDGIYNLIYISGAVNYEDWKEGELKAKLYPTATSTLFKADWFMGNKQVNKDPYLTFEQGLMNLVMQNRDKTLYIKLYPTQSDKIPPTNSAPASGTGFAVTSDGLIVTNHHVISGATSIKIRGIRGDFTKSYHAKVIIDDKNNDLAIIKIDDTGFSSLGNIPFIINGKSSDVGSSVFVMGYPLRASMGDEMKLTNGIVSSKSGFQGDITSYQITAPIQPGNSGGPLFDYSGNLIGIVNAKHSGAENASYAIKSAYLLNLFDLIPQAHKLQTVNTLVGKPLTEQVKALKMFTYIIQVN